ncbi:hypothetical protein IWZ01DRAFT_38099 [Phyllosticta capitalensis]
MRDPTYPCQVSGSASGQEQGWCGDERGGARRGCGLGFVGGSADALLCWLAIWQSGRTHAPSLANHRKHESINGRRWTARLAGILKSRRPQVSTPDGERSPSVQLCLFASAALALSADLCPCFLFVLVSCDRTRVRKHDSAALRAEETLELVRWCLASKHASFLRAKQLTNHVLFRAATPSMALIESDPFLVFSHHIQSAPPPAPLQVSRPPSDGGLGSL